MEGTKEVNKKDLHNLKSSLTAILGYLQLIEYKIKAVNPEEKEKILDLVKKATESSKYLEDQIKTMEGTKDPLVDL